MVLRESFEPEVKHLTLSVSIDELWTIHKYVRRGRDQEGQEFDKNFMIQVFNGIASISSKSRDEQSKAQWELTCEDNDLWQITRLVDMDYARGGNFVGHGLLVKVFSLLTAEDRDGEELVGSVEEFFRKKDEDVKHSSASADTGEDSGAGNGAGASNVA